MAGFEASLSTEIHEKDGKERGTKKTLAHEIRTDTPKGMLRRVTGLVMVKIAE